MCSLITLMIFKCLIFFGSFSFDNDDISRRPKLCCMMAKVCFSKFSENFVWFNLIIWWESSGRHPHRVSHLRLKLVQRHVPFETKFIYFASQRLKEFYKSCLEEVVTLLVDVARLITLMHKKCVVNSLN